MKLSTKIYGGFAFVLLLFVILTLINLRLARNTQSKNMELNVNAHILTKSAYMQRYALDMEDALRGYLLTGNSAFLTQYKMAMAGFNEADSGAIFLLNSNKVKKDALAGVANLLYLWRDSFASPLIEAKSKSIYKNEKESNEKYYSLLSAKLNERKGKDITDDIRIRFNDFDHFEIQREKVLGAELRESIKNEEIILLFIAVLCLIGGIVIALYITITLSYRIKTIKEKIDTIALGKFNASIIDTQKDELSSLAFAVNVMSENLKEKILTLEAENKVLQRELKSKNRETPGS